MIIYNINNISKIIKENGKQVVLFGAGQIGEMCLFAMMQKNINVDFFCDSMESKQGKTFSGIKIISPENLEKFDRETNIFITAYKFAERSVDEYLTIGNIGSN